MKSAVFAVVSNAIQAETVVDQLRLAGFANHDVSVLFPDVEGTNEFAHAKSTKAPEGAVIGASAGGVLGGMAGWLLGIGTLALPGVGPLIAAGISLERQLPSRVSAAFQISRARIRGVASMRTERPSSDRTVRVQSSSGRSRHSAFRCTPECWNR